MSTDRSVTQNLVEVLEDGATGFASAAVMLRESGEPDLAQRFEAYASQRNQFKDELVRMATVYGDDVDESGSAKAAAHRVWMSVKDTLSGSDPEGILEAAEQGEDHAVGEFRSALDEDLSEGLRTVVQRQLADVDRVHVEVRELRDRHS